VHIENIVNNTLKVVPTKEELEKIELLVSEIYKKNYKKIIFYAMGTSYHVINLILQFYLFVDKQFIIEVLSNDDHDTANYLLQELEKGSLIIFCSRTGNTNEIIHQLKNLIGSSDFEIFKPNILVITNLITNNKLNVILRDNSLNALYVHNGDYIGRFECFNAIFFFVIELLHPINNLVGLSEILKRKNFIEDNLSWGGDFVNRDFVSSLCSVNHSIIVYSNNAILNRITTWFKHVWYESFGKIKINIFFENYSSLFHSSIQYYLSHQKDYYFIMKLFSDNSRKANFDNNFTIYLQNMNLVEIEINKDVITLMSGLLKMTGIICTLATELDLDILSTDHSDLDKKGFFERLL
jgi:hypothetical protein